MTKQQMIDRMNEVVKQFYGCETTFGRKVQRMNVQKVTQIYNVYRLNKDEPIASQVRLLNSWVENI